MGKINVLSFAVANLIAAGEVVDRPASVIKELMENAIDSGASRITVEIQNGGVTFMRVHDNGCGIAAEDLPVAIRRHATSKIRDAEDLDGIMTLGFRGEALAAIAAVSELRIISRPHGDPVGHCIEVWGGEVNRICEQGCSEGTTVLVEELFYNVPARRKFLKRDITEGSAVGNVVEKVALSHPEIAFELISDGKTRLQTEGDGRLLSTLYALYGREFASRLLAVEYEYEGISVVGYVGRSDNMKPNRNGQTLFINGRLVKSRTILAALEQAFSSYMPQDRFPVCALFLTIDPRSVDVNVHPAKLEVKFSNEKPVFEAVYYAVKQTLENNTTRPDISPEQLSHMTYQEYRALVSTPEERAREAEQAAKRAAEKAARKLEPKLPKNAPIPPEYLTKFPPDDEPGIMPKPFTWPPKSQSAQNAPQSMQNAPQSAQNVPQPMQNTPQSAQISPQSAQTTPQSAQGFPPADATQPPQRHSPPDPRFSVAAYVDMVESGDHGPRSAWKKGRRGAEAVSEPPPMPDYPPEPPPARGYSSVPEPPPMPDVPPMPNVPPIPDVPPMPNVPPIPDVPPMPNVPPTPPAGEQQEIAHSVDAPDYRILGEAFRCYVMVERGEQLLLIDKHAAHERIIFERLKAAMRRAERCSQQLLVPLEFMLTSGEVSQLEAYRTEIEAIGFSFTTEKYTVRVSEVPDAIELAAVPDIFMTLAAQVREQTGTALLTRELIFEHALYQASCKAAIKGGREYSDEQISGLVAQLMALPDITFCPHGRPVAMTIKKSSLDRQFKRT